MAVITNKRKRSFGWWIGCCVAFGSSLDQTTSVVHGASRPVACFVPSTSTTVVAPRTTSSRPQGFGWTVRARPNHNNNNNHDNHVPSPQNNGETDLAHPSNEKRRKKKNKYDKFSKVQHDFDPFDQLLAETTQKVQDMEEAARLRKEKKRFSPQAQSAMNRSKQEQPQALSFPDTQTIDPYDPTTFGYIEIAHVTGAHGVYGWLKVQCVTGFPVERLLTAGIRHLKPKQKRAPRQVVLVEGRYSGRNEEYLLQLEHVRDREAALRLRGSILYVREEEKVELRASNNDKQDDHANNNQEEEEKEEEEKEEEYLLSDLVGLEVRYSSTDMVVGTVHGLVLAEEMCAIPELGHDTLEVLLQKGPLPSFRDELVLIPLVRQIVPKVSLVQKCLWIDPPAGLLDLTYVRSERVRIKGFLPTTASTDV